MTLQPQIDTPRAKRPKRSFASRLFGYDVFLSFALGPPPRGTHSYASDLARRLRERDFNVFFSEDELPPGEQLNSALRGALLRSRTLVVIANRGTLQEPRWVRKEVEEFVRHRPKRSVVTINVGGALQDPALAKNTQDWLGFEGKIWLDETEDTVASGIATEQIVERLATAPRRARANVRWRWLMRSTTGLLTALVIGLGVIAKIATDQTERAFNAEDRVREELRRVTASRLIADGQAMISGEQGGGVEKAILQMLAGYRMSPAAQSGGLLKPVLQYRHLQRLFTLGHVNAVAMSADGRHIVSATDDGSLRLWDANTGLAIGAPLRGHYSAASTVAISPDGRLIASGSTDHTLRIWDIKTLQSIQGPFREHSVRVTSIAFSPNGQRIAAGGVNSFPVQPEGSCLRLWDVNSRELLAKAPRGLGKEVRSAAFSPDGRRIVTGDFDSTVQVWDSETLQPIGKPLQGHTGSVTSVAFSPDGSRIVSGSYDKTLRLWDVQALRAIGEPLEGHLAEVTSVAFSPDGYSIVSGSGDKTVRFWNAKTLQPIGKPLQGYAGPLKSVAFSPDGQRLIVSGSDETLRILDAHPGDSTWTPRPAHLDVVSAVAYSPDSSRIVSGSRDKAVRVWDAESLQLIGKQLLGHSAEVTSVAFSPDGHYIASASNDKTLRLWDARMQPTFSVDPLFPLDRSLAVLEGHSAEVTSLAFSPDGHYIVSGSKDETMRLWNVQTRRPIGEPLQGHSLAVNSVAISQDGRHIVSGSDDATLRLWDAKTLQPIGEPLEGHSISAKPSIISVRPPGVTSVAFSPDGRLIVSGGWGKSVRLWDDRSQRPAGITLNGHTDAVISVVFSHDGRYIVSSGKDETLRFWDAQTGRQIGLIALEGERRWEWAHSVAVAPDGRHIVSGHIDGSIRVWPAPKAWPDELCKKLTHNMSRKEWNEWVSPEIGYTCQCPDLPIAQDDPMSGSPQEICNTDNKASAITAR